MSHIASYLKLNSADLSISIFSRQLIPQFNPGYCVEFLRIYLRIQVMMKYVKFVNAKKK